MILTVISTLLGLLTSTVPSLINYFTRKRELEYDIELTKLKVEAAKNGLELNRDITDIKAVVEEGNNIRDNDSKLDGGSFVNSLRASVRPVITYTLFAMFIGVKLCVAIIILVSGSVSVANMKLALDAILDENTMAIISTILGYYFGARALEKMQAAPENKVTGTVKMKPVINK